MAILLAPMEGLLDFVLRDVLTSVGGVDRCVSEFIRVTDTLLPEKMFLRTMPELLNNSKTSSGVLVRGQLLGSDPACLADNAARLAEMGSAGIDLNFGCPAKLVNRHGGGAVLLDTPEIIEEIISSVRRAVPKHITVSAKMRLGNNDDSRAIECAHAIESGGAEEVVVHARTKEQGYRPPAYWEKIAEIRESIKIPVIANGEIWTPEDAKRCIEISGCHDIMIGRGAVSNPGLALAIKGSIQENVTPPFTWEMITPLLARFWELMNLKLAHRSPHGRLKQWLNMLRRDFPEAEDAYQHVRTITDPLIISAWIESLQSQEPIME